VILNIPFNEFPKISRYSRDVIITEKIDGTNAQIYVPGPVDDGYGEVFAGSRTRWIEPGNDNFGFAAWVQKNKDDLLQLGPGFHFGEWWGSGIQRGYGLKEKRFSLFNVHRWGPDGKDEAMRPACCQVVPVLWRGNFSDLCIEEIVENLRITGSMASPGFRPPEGVVVYHTAGNVLFKKTLEKDDQPKGQK
jgi:hypothetical protein